MKLVELIVDDLAELLGFTANSLVGEPAHEESFYAFKRTDVEDLIITELIRQELSKELNLNEDEDLYELTIGDYQTRHYDMCPGASALYTKIESGEIDTDMGLAIRAAKLQDVLFYLEKHTVQQMENATFEDVIAAQNLVYEIMQLAKMMGLEEEHQYVYGHLQAIRELAIKSNNLEIQADSLPDYSNEVSSSFSFASQDQQIVVGPLLIPHKKILRVDEEGTGYEVFFSEETVRTIGMGMMRDKLLDKLNLEHDPNQPVEGFMMSSWFVEDPKMDTALAYGFKNLVKGSWYGMYKVLDPAVWQKVKNKEVTGFSIEALLAEKLINN